MLPNPASQIPSRETDLKIRRKKISSRMPQQNRFLPSDTLYEIGQNASIPKFHFFKDGLNGTIRAQSNVACFLSGTYVRTPSGDVTVETLEIGDTITTLDSKSRQIKWIGRRKYSPPIPANEDIIPVLIKAGTFAPNIPDRDLLISPHHGIKVDDYIVPAGALINDVSIYQNTEITDITYYHIHTDKHEIIIANNTPVETFINVDSIQMFDNAEEFYFLYPESSMASEFFTLPRLEFGVELERLRQKISLRNGLIEPRFKNAEVIGYLDYADRHEVVGWAYSPQKPNEPLKVELLNNESVLAKVVANIYRPDVKRAGFGSGRYGFSFVLPAPLPSFKRHSLSVRVIGQSKGLPGSPVILDPGLAEDLLQTGQLDRILEHAAKGASSKIEIEELTDTLLIAARNLNVISNRLSTSKVFSYEKNRNKQNPIILFLDSQWPITHEDAGSNAIVSHISAFKELGYGIDFCATCGPPRRAAEYRALNDLEEMGVNCLSKIDVLPENIIRDASRPEIKIIYLHKLATASNYLGLARHHMPKAKIIYSVADLHHIRLTRQAELENSPELEFRSKSIRAAELCYIQMADCVFTHSTAEFDYIQKILPQVNIHVVRWGIEKIQLSPSQLYDKNIGFLGSANHEPNLDAVIHLNENILPLVWRARPEVNCLVVGSDWPTNLTRQMDPRVKFLGPCPNLSHFFGAINLTIAPLRFGSGIKGKVVESMAHCRPCVMSPIAAEGLRLSKTLSKLVGPEDHQVATILKLLDDQQFNRLAANASLKLISSDFSQKAVMAAIDDALVGRAAVEN